MIPAIVLVSLWVATIAVFIWMVWDARRPKAPPQSYSRCAVCLCLSCRLSRSPDGALHCPGCRGIPVAKCKDQSRL